MPVIVALWFGYALAPLLPVYFPAAFYWEI